MRVIGGRAQQKDIDDRRADLDEELGRGQQEERQLALQQDEQAFRQNLDMDRFDSDESYRRDVLAQQKDIDDRRADLDEELGRGQLSMQERQLALQQDEQAFRQNLDMDRFDSDESYRRDVLAQQKDIDDRRADLDEELGRGQLSMQERQLALQQDEQAFRQNFDNGRFTEEAAYRREALKHQASIDNRRADLAGEQLGLDRERLSSQEWAAFRQDWNNGYAAYQHTLAGINSNTEMSPTSRTSAIAAARQGWEDHQRTLLNLHGPSMDVEWDDVR